MGFLDDILSGLALAGNVLDTPWAGVRTAITERDLGAGFDALFDFDQRASGKQMLNSLFGEFEGDELAGLAAEIIPDMLLPGAGAYKLLSRFKGARPVAQAAPVGRGYLDAIDKAVPTPTVAGGLVDDEVMKILGSNPIIESAEAMPLGLPAPRPDAPPYYSRLRNAVEALPGENFKSQSVLNQLKRVAPEGFSQEELEWSKLGDVLGQGPVVSKGQLLGQMDEALPSYSPEWSRAQNVPWDKRPPGDQYMPSLPTKWEQYSTGTGDYAEHIAKLPGEDVYQSNHWDAKNPLLHLRTETITRPDGGKTLLANELQSDWHQAARERGYKTGPYEVDPKWERHKNGIYTGEGSLVIEPMTNGKVRLESKGSGMVELYNSVDEAKAAGVEKLKNMRPDERLPNAPFKKDWPLLGLKELIRQGVEQGVDEIAWLPGGRVQSMVGGALKGQQQFYDKDLVNTANKYLKSRGWNTAVEAIEAEARGPTKNIGLMSPRDIIETAGTSGQDMVDAAIDRVAARHDLTYERVSDLLLGSDVNDLQTLAGRVASEFRREFPSDFGQAIKAQSKAPKTAQFRIKVTPEMKRDLRERGQPLMNLIPFAGGGLTAALMADEA